jgi:hypothetical protein
VLVLERRSLGWQKLESGGLGERLGAPEVFIYGTGKEIVAGDHSAYPEKFGKWRVFPQPNRHRVIWDSIWVVFGLTG